MLRFVTSLLIISFNYIKNIWTQSYITIQIPNSNETQQFKSTLPSQQEAHHSFWCRWRSYNQPPKQGLTCNSNNQYRSINYAPDGSGENFKKPASKTQKRSPVGKLPLITCQLNNQNLIWSATTIISTIMQNRHNNKEKSLY